FLYGSFFFFQAEDGIRDFHVTGVQTCALPISPPRGPDPVPAVDAPAVDKSQVLADELVDGAVVERRALLAVVEVERLNGVRVLRSEERRVGKEGKYRREPLAFFIKRTSSISYS